MFLPTVKEVNQGANNVVLTLDITPEMEAFEGHFEGAPIIPGVIQIGWAINFADRYLQKLSSLDVDRIDALKFQQVIQPNTRLILSLEMLNDKLLFSFSSNGSKHSSGKIVIK